MYIYDGCSIHKSNVSSFRSEVQQIDREEKYVKGVRTIFIYLFAFIKFRHFPFHYQMTCWLGKGSYDISNIPRKNKVHHISKQTYRLKSRFKSQVWKQTGFAISWKERWEEWKNQIIFWGGIWVHSFSLFNHVNNRSCWDPASTTCPSICLHSSF